jgi:hypothetical protein
MSQQAERRALAWGAAVGALTSVHHVYGAIVYDTIWRLHAVALSAAALLVMLAALAISRRFRELALGRVAWWLFWAVNAVVFGLGVGGFEGVYNHVLKNVLWLGGLPLPDLRVLFPAPTYEMPNDIFFEFTGVAQVIPAALAARWLAVLLAERFGRRRSGVVPRPGDVLAKRELVTIADTPVLLPDPTHRVHLQFRRFAGCPVCSLHLRSMVERRVSVEAAGIREIVVFHSSADELRRYEGELPFAIVADPDKHLYREFGVESSPRALLDPRAWPGIAKAIVAGLLGCLVHGRALPPLRPPGGRYGLPADFLVDRDGRVLAVHYGEHADDQWSVDELLALAEEPKCQPGCEAELATRPRPV